MGRGEAGRVGGFLRIGYAMMHVFGWLSRFDELSLSLVNEYSPIIGWDFGDVEIEVERAARIHVSLSFVVP